MANSNTGTTNSLNERRVQALQALISSIAPDASARDNETQNDLIHRLSTKIDQLGLGDVMPEDGAMQRRNEKGELLNEEGLPIVDITEDVVDDTELKNDSGAAVASDQSVLRVPSVERDKRTGWRDNILDLLEEEEEKEEQREAEREREQLADAARKKRQEAKTIAEARNLQKKMGKAFLQSSASPLSSTSSSNPVTALVPSSERKSVSFAETDPPEAPDGPAIDWGDVVPAKLRPPAQQPSKGVPTMKGAVVERIPGSNPTNPRQLSSPNTLHGDSDDESDLEVDSRLSGDNDPDDSDTDTEVSFVTGDEKETDWDAAEHQREVALAYIEKREALGKDAARAMMSHSHDGEEYGEHEWEQADVPLDATLAHPPPKSSVSRFKAERLASARPLKNQSSSASSTSIGASIIPSSARNDLRRAVRTGRLENDKLVGPDSDSDRDVEESERDKEVEEAFFDMLRRGELQNLGPDFQETPPSRPCTLTSSVSLTEPVLTVANPVPSNPNAEGIDGSASSIPKAPPSRISQFKSAHLAAPSRNGSISPASLSGPPTPASLAERSPPKLPDAGISQFSSAILPPVAPRSSTSVQVPFSSVILPATQNGQQAPPGSTPSPSSIGAQIQTPSIGRPVMANTVRESSRAGAGSRDVGAETRTELPRKVSRFRAERM